jgi:hypothetical protein
VGRERAREYARRHESKRCEMECARQVVLEECGSLQVGADGMIH